MDALGEVLSTYEGWGVRITFVPADEIHEEPQTEVLPRRQELN